MDIKGIGQMIFFHLIHLEDIGILPEHFILIYTSTELLINFFSMEELHKLLPTQ